MANLSLIRFALACFFVIASQFAHAQASVAPTWTTPNYYFGCGCAHQFTQTGTNPDTVVDAECDHANTCGCITSGYHMVSKFYGPDGTTYGGTCVNSSGGGGFNVGASASCPSGTTFNAATKMCDYPNNCPNGQQWNNETNSCETVCPTGYHKRVPDNGQCEKDCSGDQVQRPDGTCGCNSGNTFGTKVSWANIGAYQSKGDCFNGCQVSPVPAMTVCPTVAFLGLVGQSNSANCYGLARTTGAICDTATVTPVSTKFTPPPPATPVPPTPERPADPVDTVANNANPQACAAAGGTYYESNGQGRCGSAGGGSTNVTAKTEKSTTTTAGGQTSTTETITVSGTGPNGTPVSTTQTTTTGSGGTTVTRTTGTGGGTGGGTGTGTGVGGGDGLTDCDKYPNTVGCMNPGTPAEEGDALERKPIGPNSISPVSVGGNATCPADIPLPKGMTFSFAPFCQYASAMRPIIIALAWLSAAFLIFGLKEST